MRRKSENQRVPRLVRGIRATELAPDLRQRLDSLVKRPAGVDGWPSVDAPFADLARDLGLNPLDAELYAIVLAVNRMGCAVQGGNRHLLRGDERPRTTVDDRGSSLAAELACDLHSVYAQYAAMALEVGLDPRPSTLTDMLLWGVDTVLGADFMAITPRRVVARVSRTSIPVHTDQDPAERAAWRQLQILPNGRHGVRVVRLISWSLTPPDDTGTGLAATAEWNRFQPGEAAVLSELELDRLLRLTKRRDPRWVDGIPSYEESVQVAQAVDADAAAHKKRVRHDYICWRDCPAGDQEYYVVIEILPSEVASPFSGSTGPLSPVLITSAQVKELALVTPDVLALEISRKSKMEVLDGFTEARGDDSGRRHRDQSTMARLAAAVGDDDDVTREFIVLQGVLRLDLNTLWAEVLRARAIRGLPTPRTPVDFPATEGDVGTLGRVNARQYWFDLLQRAGGRLTRPVEGVIIKETQQAYPLYAQCGNEKCRQWWIHGCDQCRAARATVPCTAFAVCPKCRNDLIPPATRTYFEGDAGRIIDELLKFRDSRRKRKA